MKKGIFWCLTVTSLIFGVGLVGNTGVEAGSKDMVAGKRAIFKDDSIESMRDVFKRQEIEGKEYKKIMLINSEKSVKLLKEIRDLLRQLNEQ